MIGQTLVLILTTGLRRKVECCCSEKGRVVALVRTRHMPYAGRPSALTKSPRQNLLQVMAHTCWQLSKLHVQMHLRNVHSNALVNHDRPGQENLVTMHCAMGELAGTC